MKQNPLRFLPLIIILFSVIGVISWYARNQKDVKPIKPETVNPSELESDGLILSPTPKNSFFFSDETSNEPNLIPKTTEPATDTSAKEVLPAEDVTTGGISDTETVKVTTITKTITCTPVYGMADSCEEHIVVDTGAESAVAYSLSAFSYLAGLIAFVKSKKA